MRRRAVLLLLGALLAPLPVLAGRGCEASAPDPVTLQKAFRFALQTRDALEASGARVALLARAGQDLSAYGLRYSHAAFVVRDHPKGRWTVVHALNTCGTDRSGLYDEGLANFYLDGLFAWDALLLVPSPAVQERLGAFLAKDAARFHAPAYNMVANPFSTRYQNSNQWLAETLAGALSAAPLADRAAAQRWLWDQGFRPAILPMPPVTQVAAALRPNVALDDQPRGRLREGMVETVTVDVLFGFLRHLDPTSREQRLRL